ncbi:MAG: 1,2-diacylglycerol 3-glucosyltransferase [Candidatus Adlerbacteria bacterium]|nr:1,2-diacylglycerol 3-glucosyltransferase [Candidatus Adlerbacteria bacterium]
MERVLIFSLAYYPHVGGAEIAVKEITDRIRDIEFHMITMRFDPRDAEVEKLGNVIVHRVGKSASYLSKILFIPRAAWTARTLHRTYNFGAAWVVMTYMVLPLVLLRRLGVTLPYVLNLQDGDPFERVFKRWFIVPVRPLIISGFHNASVVQPLSNFLAQWARELGYKGTVNVIPQGVDLPHFQQEFSPAEIAAFKQTLNKKEGDVFLITTSRLVHKNAIDDAIRAMPLLPAHVQFVVYGTGTEERSLKSLARELGVENRVQFLGHIGHNDMPKYLRVCDIFIRPSRTEGFGSSFVEAMAAGLPVIATQEGGIADFLFDARRNPGKLATGWAVDKDAPEQIAAAVKDILDNPQRTQKIVDHAREMVMLHYDWGLVASRMRQEVFAPILHS